MLEKFNSMTVNGTINVTCKFDDGSTRMWSADKATTLQRIKELVTSYARKGLRLTLRQLHYQLVVRNWIVNHDTAYKKLGNLLSDMRYAGIIDWDHIEDRGRVPYIPYAVEDAQDALRDAVDLFRMNRQTNQENVIEVWTEKDALSGILKRVTSEYHIRLVVNKGYSSSSAMYDAYTRVCEAAKAGKRFTILYLGDHDPSGVDMVRDIQERITSMLMNGSRLTKVAIAHWEASKYTLHDLADFNEMYLPALKLLQEYDEDADALFSIGQQHIYLYDAMPFTISAIGLSKEQIKQYNLPPNPTKLTDTRAKAYIAEHGKTCWEVDALQPEVLTDIVEDAIRSHMNLETYDAALQDEAEELDKLKDLIDKT